MPAASRHAKPRTPGTRLGVPVVAAATLAGVAAAFVSLHGGSAAPRPARYAIAATSSASGLTDDQMTTAVRRDVAAVAARMMIQRTRTAARHRHVAALAAARLAQQQAARQLAARQQARQAAAQPPPPSPSPTPAPSSGGDAASSPLGVCVRNTEEGGSYAWGPGNGGGAYQFLLGTWETYGGAASEYGVGGPSYQDQIFNNAVAAGGASNWTNYDGC